MEWSDNFLVGIPEIDAQHRGLLWIAFQVLQRSANGEDWSAVHTAMNYFAKSARAHFLYEEALMRIVSYPKLTEHQAEHRQCDSKLIALEQQSLAGPSSLEMITYLTTWLYGHITTFDKELALFLQERGAVVSSSTDQH